MRTAQIGVHIEEQGAISMQFKAKLKKTVSLSFTF